VRKRVAIPSLPGLYIETVILFPLGISYWVYLSLTQNSAFMWTIDTPITWLLILAGLVIVLALLAFNSAATKLRLGTVGYFQYLAPTINLVLAVLIYIEPKLKKNSSLFR